VAVIAVAVTVLLVALGVALAASSTPQFCGACKSHEPYVQEYRASSHADVNCEQCHTKPGPLFFLTSKLEALQQPVHQITGDYETPILGTVLNSSCRRCHTNDTLFTPGSAKGIRVQHRHLIEAGFLCTRCHSTVGHGDAIPEGSRTYPTMEQCLICHNNEYTSADGRVATAECDLCHVTRDYDAQPVSHSSEGWETRHGAVGVLSTCSACHTEPNACRECHSGLLMPHPESWLYGHGARAESIGRQSCQQCHDVKRYCRTCHQVAMPHPRRFVSTHPAAVERAGAPTCFNCHTLDNCQACHEQHATGEPRGHSLFEGIEYSPAPRPSPTASPATASGGQ
jgi:nitrate/TMAO reductase-like tetraheme cytochrome c subunit